MRILVADTETSGLSKQDGICQLAFTEINPQLEVIASWDSLIDPECPISASASGIHGITDDMVADKPTMAEAMELLEQQFGHFNDVLLCGHNCQFDHRFLQPYWGITAQLCTLKVARRLVPEAPDCKLQTLKFFLGLGSSIEGAHSAAADVADTLALLKHLLGRADMDLFELMGWHLRPQRIEIMPWGKHKGAALAELPASYRQWLLTLPDLSEDLRWSLT